MSEYYVKRGPNWGEFKVTKFEDSTEPVAEYTLRGGAGKLTCDCPAYILGRTRPCKHLPMVIEYLKAGQPHPFLYQERKAA